MNQTILLFKLSTENHRKIGKHCREDPYLNQNPTANWVTSTRWFCKNACGPVCLMRVGEKQKLWTIITINHCQSLIIIINHYQPFITIDYQPIISPGLVFSVRPCFLESQNWNQATNSSWLRFAAPGWTCLRKAEIMGLPIGVAVYAKNPKDENVFI